MSAIYSIGFRMYKKLSWHQTYEFAKVALLNLCQRFLELNSIINYWDNTIVVPIFKIVCFRVKVLGENILPVC